MRQFIKPEFKVKSSLVEKNLFQFELQPLVQGFGTTLGNSLRRVLLSVMPGTAIYAFRITNAEQEFQTLAGVRENALEISLNVSKIILQANPVIFTDQSVLTLELKHPKGVKTLTAGDIQPFSGVKVINPQQVIAHIVNEQTPLQIRFLIRRDYGYATFEENQRRLAAETAMRTGFIAVNSQFSPVVRAFYEVQEIRVGEAEILEKLTFGLKTNNAVLPNDCLAQASKILITHLEHLHKLAAEKFDFGFTESAPTEDTVREITLQELDFSERTINALQNNAIHTLSQLQKMTKKEVLEIRNLGQKSLKEIEEKLDKDYNIHLKDE